MSESSAIFSNLIIRIESNLYAGVTDMVPLLGVDKDSNVKILVDITWNDE